MYGRSSDTIKGVVMVVVVIVVVVVVVVVFVFVCIGGGNAECVADEAILK